MPRQLEAVDLFAGAGGFSLGLVRAGFRIALANEYSVDPEWTYRWNLLKGTPEGEFSEDPEELSAYAVREHRLKVRTAIEASRTPDTTRVMRGGPIATALPTSWLSQWMAAGHTDVDVLVGGPPCQGFSAANQARLTDPRNTLVYELVRVVRVLRPKIVVIENVPGMLERHNSVVREAGRQLIDVLGDAGGYAVRAELLTTTRYGVPQSRRRLFIIGVRSDLITKDALTNLHARLFPPTCPSIRLELPRSVPLGGGEYITAREALGDLVTPPTYDGTPVGGLGYVRGRGLCSDFRLEMSASRERYLAGATGDAQRPKTFNARYFNHERSFHEANVEARFRALRLAAKADPNLRCASGSLVEAAKSANHKLVFTKKSSQRVLVEREWPSITVTSLPDDLIHYSEDRIPTVREMARLQSFPDWFEFRGVRTSGHVRRQAGVFVPQYTQVANAVPPRVAFAVAGRLRLFLTAVAEDPQCQFDIPGGLFESHATGSARRLLNVINQEWDAMARLQLWKPKQMGHGLEDGFQTPQSVDLSSGVLLPIWPEFESMRSVDDTDVTVSGNITAMDRPPA